MPTGIYQRKPRSEGFKQKFRGKNNPNWKGGKPNCPICGKKLARREAKSCSKHKIAVGVYSWNKGKGVVEKECSNCRKIFTSYNFQNQRFCSMKCWGKYNSGENNHKWVNGNYKERQERNDSAYQAWRINVWVRDGFKCKINNQDCSGKIIAHHILPWRDYPELRYNINNGITLCPAHHPRKRAEEKALIPIFQELMQVSKVII